MKARFGLQAKLQVAFGLSTAIICALLVVFVWIRVNATLSALVESSMADLASSTAAGIDSQVDDALIVAKTMAQIFEDYESLPLAERRKTLNAQVKALLERNATFMSVWSVWEPNALDGMDASYIDTPY